MSCVVTIVLQVTKTTKWQCKVCGQKQSTIKVYAHGTGADCRKYVQKLNTVRGQIDEVSGEKSLEGASSQSVTLDAHSIGTSSNCKPQVDKAKSKWSVFLDESVSQQNVSGHFENEETDHVTTDWAELRDSKKRKRVEHHTSFTKSLRTSCDQTVEVIKNSGWPKDSAKSSASLSFENVCPPIYKSIGQRQQNSRDRHLGVPVRGADTNDWHSASNPVIIGASVQVPKEWDHQVQITAPIQTANKPNKAKQKSLSNKWDVFLDDNGDDNGDES
ncbi:uncharacterized protein LOC131942402 isoform X2 [Physella acuta]|uniref:uncharacterized protein LOC131942402 isoform X2 n=1 Tax=Physella acuta TaxID=109671 RepID=UPI0027DCC694|nr:uncharacterized protein LOC131942402 isoform X2 [Physella acuta]